jgi:hypothetical protein
MISPRFHDRIGKVCALVAATLVLPVLAHANQNQNGGNGGNNNNQNNNNQGIPSVPDGGPGIVLLITTIGAILVFSARLSSRKEA